MKKLIVSAFALTLISFASVQAQTTQQATQPTQQEAVTTQEAATTATEAATTEKPVVAQKASKEDKVVVKPEDLPEGIKKTIKGEEFSGWTVKKAFLVTEPNNTQYYELQVGNGKENARVKLDKNGNNVG
ncbi:hypothetical protein [Dyadobacter sp. CY323]|uniref:hypothetical protein n=1 Tax=Dyadobacter sp. CY323 TaxID=2907302 RepID=UPI001F21A536|nr:hypothetical protein [Dyadobacter sp. CY323]MCE6987772.1 hypothetical protein [Dyadobacter sp. CY323]